ncbi:MAG: glycerophosphodiester phosphodiesterase [Bacteroidales bacterium]|jgi:glycerophosphoryl diester phosphodiesterase|nr:glycerophosphodiester phosphodiesterase [Bacteroidales bacterium]
MKKLLIVGILGIVLSFPATAQTKIVSHRGFWKTAGSSQNSLASFRKADSIKVFASEFDVWMTVEGKLIVNHDRVFKGVNMETSPYKEIRKVRLDNGEQIPTLKEYLENAVKYDGVHLILEVKSLKSLKREDEEVAKIVKLVNKYKLQERTYYISFSINACLAFRKYAPDAKVYYLSGDYTPKKCKKLGFAGIDYSQKVLYKHPDWIKQAHDCGLEVNVWTVDDKRDMEYFISHGADYLTTNYPLLCDSLNK